MSLQETLAALQAEQEEALKNFNPNDDEDQIEEEEQQVEKELPEQEDELVEEVFEEPVKEPEPEEKPDASAYARMRREAAAAKKRAEELEAEIQRLKTQPVEQEPEQVEQETIVLPKEVQDLVAERRTQLAVNEFKSYEHEFRQSVKNYDQVADQYQNAIAHSIRIQNPRMTPEQISQQAAHIIMVKARDYLNAGFNPIEELYHEALDLGYTGEVEQPTPQPSKKPDLARVAANQKRSSGFSAPSGSGTGGAITLKTAADFSPSEWMALSPAEKRRILPNG